MPDDCVVKIDQGPEADLLLCAYLKVSGESRLRTRIGNNARLHIAQHGQIRPAPLIFHLFVTLSEGVGAGSLSTVLPAMLRR